LRHDWKSCPSRVLPRSAVRRAGRKIKNEIKNKIKINVKRNGQECPFHTGKVEGSWASPLKPKGGLNGPPAFGFAGNTRSAESRQAPRLRIHAGADEFLVFVTVGPFPKESSPLEQPAQDNENSAGMFC